MKATAAAAFLALAVATQSAMAFEECKTQATFNVRMCKSAMCTSCTMAWCSKSCQELQEAHPGCRCEDWPEARVSYSGGEFEGKGKYGDVGDYSKGMYEPEASPALLLAKRF
mmetsp:Transcript_3220/g.7726  ORF Transcript_3220/g.7726 Transcript_3220/m.7726 type:complete len:112 (-) Transcript_3220:128-463(-)